MRAGHKVRRVRAQKRRHTLIMGMFDKDKEVGLMLTRAFPKGEQFILESATITREDYPTKFGPSPQVTLRVKPIGAGRAFEVTTLASAIVAKVREAEADDFPAVVFWTEAPSERAAGGVATVLQYVGPVGGLAPLQAPEAPSGGFTAREGDDDIPF